MPLLRYRIGDLAEKRVQPYGNEFVIHGRASAALTAHDGARVTTWQVDECFADAHGFAHYELRQNRNGECVLLFVPDGDEPTAENLRNMTARLGELLKIPAGEIKTEAMKTLLPSPSGKFRLTCPAE